MATDNPGYPPRGVCVTCDGEPGFPDWFGLKTGIAPPQECTWVDGIGVPLEQVEEDYKSAGALGRWAEHAAHMDRVAADVLALVAEVKRLRGWQDQAAVLEKIIKWEQDRARRLANERDEAQDKCQRARLSASLNAEEARVATARVAELESALKFYADPDTYEVQPRRVRPIIEDAGAKAREALHG